MLGIRLPEAPSLEVVRKQVIDLFGEPTFIDTELGFDRAIWVHDVDGTKIAAGKIDAMQSHTLIRVTIIDYELRHKDRIAAARQINAEIEGLDDAEASALDL